ncbi:MAG: twin-arginine translocase TatA/TatE family subunit [Bacteroidota bacterium]|nr:twin-arginine translocase TatA/TatE family subunit [Bacteroidota bacterium]
MKFDFIFLGLIGGQEILIIALIILLLFGGRKIPQLMRGLGKGIKEFKNGTSGLGDNDDDEQEVDDESKGSKKEG